MSFAVSEAANLAMHGMAFLALHGRSGAVATAQVAQRFGFSENHLSKVFQRLTKAQLVRSIRGPKGGFSLAREASTITLLEVYEAMDGPMAQSTGCAVGASSCHFDACVFGDLPQSVHDQVRSHFAKTSLADIVGDLAGE